LPISSRPSLRAISAQRCENWPNLDISTRSPRLRVLLIAASHAPVPEDGYMNTRPVSLAKTFFRSANSGRASSGKSGARWSCCGTFIARRTASGTLVGPGTYKWTGPLGMATTALRGGVRLGVRALRAGGQLRVQWVALGQHPGALGQRGS